MRIEQFSTIRTALLNSEGGQSLLNTYRWSDFRRHESDAEWMRIFGATGQVMSHSTLMYGVARSFLEREGDRFSEEEQREFLLGAICHDWGEAIINGNGVGDIKYSDKTEDSILQEMIIAQSVILSLDLGPTLTLELISSYQQVVAGLNPKLADAFNAIERCEYVMTAMKVFQNCRRLEQRGKPVLAEEIPLVGRVLVKNLTYVLKNQAPNYPDSIGVFFAEQAHLIDEMFAASEQWLRTTCEWNGVFVDHPRLTDEFVVEWSAFKAAHTDLSQH